MIQLFFNSTHNSALMILCVGWVQLGVSHFKAHVVAVRLGMESSEDLMGLIANYDSLVWLAGDAGYWLEDWLELKTRVPTDSHFIWFLRTWLDSERKHPQTSISIGSKLLVLYGLSSETSTASLGLHSVVQSNHSPAQIQGQGTQILAFNEKCQKNLWPHYMWYQISLQILVA